MEFCEFLELLVLDWAQVVHYYPYYKGQEPYNPSQEIPYKGQEFLTNAFEHVYDVLSTSVDFSCVGNGTASNISGFRSLP